MSERVLALLATSILTLGAGCDRNSGPARPVTAEVEWHTGGSASGDFGPPQGEPIKAALTSPPNVPPPVDRTYPAKVIVELEVRELRMEISEGVNYTFWTFGGTVPGSFIRVRQGDTVEFHLMTTARPRRSACTSAMECTASSWSSRPVA